MLVCLLPWLCLNFFGEALHNHAPSYSRGALFAFRAAASERQGAQEVSKAHQFNRGTESECLACQWAAQSLGVVVPISLALGWAASTCSDTPFAFSSPNVSAIPHSTRGPPLS